MHHLPRENTAKPAASKPESPEKSSGFAIEKILI